MKSIADRIDALSEGGGSRADKSARQDSHMAAADPDKNANLLGGTGLQRAKARENTRAGDKNDPLAKRQINVEKEKRFSKRSGQKPFVYTATPEYKKKMRLKDRFPGRTPGPHIPGGHPKDDRKVESDFRIFGGLIDECRQLLEGGGSRRSKSTRQDKFDTAYAAGKKIPQVNQNDAARKRPFADYDRKTTSIRVDREASNLDPMDSRMSTGHALRKLRSDRLNKQFGIKTREK